MDLKKLKRRVQMTQEDLPVLLRNAEDPKKDATGGATAILVDQYRVLALGAYFLESSIQRFREQLVLAGRCDADLVARAQCGQPIAKSLSSVMCYQAVLTLLAAGNGGEARALAQMLSGHEDVPPFDVAFGYCLKYAVLEDLNAFRVRFEDLKNELRAPDVKPLAGYADMMEGILARHLDACQAAAQRIVADHPKMIAKGGLFHLTANADLNFWGLGIVNLARMRGLPVTVPDNEYLPSDLLI